MLYKSEDDGETWSDPINVQMDGPDGLPGVLNYMTDEQWDELFVDPDPLREEVPFTSGFDCDLVIDANGNPHIAVAVGVGDLTASYYITTTAYPYLALMDITSPDGGDTWTAVEIGRRKTSVVHLVILQKTTAYAQLQTGPEQKCFSHG